MESRIKMEKPEFVLLETNKMEFGKKLNGFHRAQLPRLHALRNHDT